MSLVVILAIVFSILSVCLIVVGLNKRNRLFTLSGLLVFILMVMVGLFTGHLGDFLNGVIYGYTSSI